MNIIEKIHKHEKLIATKQKPCFCPKCKSTHVNFTLHECRYRLFHVIIDSLVHTIESFLGRWKCSLCKKTFTSYPEYALPYKRYVKDHCLSFSQAYVKDDTETYRSVSSAIGYTTRTQEIDNRMLAWSTVWRWLRFFGSLKYTLRNAFDLIRQADPNSPVFRQMFPIYHGKYKSKQRKTSLDQSIQLFSAEPEYHRIFGHSFFSPELATKSGWS
ncbi:hypothetical protein [Candidatus Kuenenia sp.]|uniref:hypothetical protein n=1 Tax=Candidatus Kuenenia sp. TaxID=2499824 RepID=UPI003AF8B20E